MSAANSVFSSLPTTIFETMSRLAGQSGAVNLGQGFPEGLENAELIARLAQAAAAGPHQYPPMMGLPALRQAIARHQTDHFAVATQPEQVMVTSGATEALAACLFALIEPGDEVVLFEPLYDSYLPIIRRAGGIPRLVRLTPPAWDIPRDQLEQTVGPRTKLILVNSPANPCGKVFRRDELTHIAALAERHDSLILSDEVYEHLCFDPCRHISLRSVTNRAIKVGSAGKIFSVTGWKVGWVVADPVLLAPIAKAHQYLTFTTPPALQQAIAWGLDHLAQDYTSLAARLAARRDHLRHGLEQVGFHLLPCHGSYFLCADFRPLRPDLDDQAFCRHITEQAGVAAIPVSAFYDGQGPAHYARFCFAKGQDVLDQAIHRLKAHFCP